MGVALFAALIGYLLRQFGGGELASQPVRADGIVAAAVVLLASYAVQASAWHALLRATGETQPLAVDAGRWCVSILGKYVPGKVFNALGRIYLYRGSVIGPAGMTAAYATESLLTASAAACVAAVALWFVRDAVPPLALIASTIAAVGGLAVAFSTLFDRAAGWVAARVLSSSPLAPIAIRDRVLPFALQFASYALMGAGLYELARASPLGGAVPVAAVVGALCLSGIAGMAAFVVPTGIGVREGMLVWLLASFTNPGSAAWIAVASRVWFTAGDAIAVVVGTMLLRFVGATERMPRERRFREGLESFGFLEDPEGRARRGRRVVALLRRFHRDDLAPLRVLDVGCSAGLIAREVAQHVAFTVGIDPDVAAMHYAARHTAQPEQLAFACAAGEALPFADSAFDLVLCNHVYEHARDPHAMMREIARVLRSGGLCWFAGGHTLQLVEPHYGLPLLSMLPRAAASWVVRASCRGDGYAIRFLPPWRLRELFAPFAHAQLVSVDVLRDPERYELLASDLPGRALLLVLVRALAPVLVWLAPTQLWLLRR